METGRRGVRALDRQGVVDDLKPEIGIYKAAIAVIATMETTTIQVSVENYQWLNSQKRPGESFDDVLDRLRQGGVEEAAQPAAEPSETLPEGLDLPGSGETLERRRAALGRLYAHLQREGLASRGDFLDLIDGEDVGYASAESFWSNCVKGRDSLRALPGVESPGEGGHTWRYEGKD